MALLPPLVLLVEDDKSIREYAAEVLREAGYVVLAASTADEALFRIEQDGAAIDVLFTNIALPGPVSGFELARLAKARNPRIEVIYGTDFVETVNHAAAPADAVDRLLRKPYSRKELEAEMMRAVNGDRRGRP